MHLPGILRVIDPAPGAALPILVDSPHSGAMYPRDFHYACDKAALQRYEDRYVDRLIADFPAMGATVICAEVPRTYIDLNRAENDLRDAQVRDLWPRPVTAPKHAARGTGLVWETAGGKAIYDHPPTGFEIRDRVNIYYRPYYAAMTDRAARLKKQFGALWHLNVHSMPRDVDADIILGNRDNRSCSRAFIAMLEGAFAAHGLRVKRNVLYKGARLTEVFGDPHRQNESVQIEINKGLYLKDDMLCIAPAAFAQLQSILNSVLKSVADYAADRLALNTDENAAFIAASRSSMATSLPSAASDVTP